MASKTVTTGEGGMPTDREDLYNRIQVLRDHGRQPRRSLVLE
jgi:dTDP-4-amino-4,6-dideoxygalactose transaminase